MGGRHGERGRLTANEVSTERQSHWEVAAVLSLRRSRSGGSGGSNLWAVWMRRPSEHLKRRSNSKPTTTRGRGSGELLAFLALSDAVGGG